MPGNAHRLLLAAAADAADSDISNVMIVLPSPLKVARRLKITGISYTCHR
jgi:hypothetical protein